MRFPPEDVFSAALVAQIGLLSNPAIGRTRRRFEELSAAGPEATELKGRNSTSRAGRSCAGRVPDDVRG
jgi:hypothetical protein